MLRVLIFTIVLGLGGAGVHQLSLRGAAAIEASVEARVAHGLSVLGFDWADVEVDGLIVALSGNAPDSAEQALAVEASRTIAHLGRIIDGTSATLAPPEHREQIRLEFHSDDSGLTLIGRLHGEGMREGLLAAIDRRLPGTNVDDLTGIDAARPPEDWGPEIAVGLAAIELVPRAFVRIEPGQILVEGVASDPEERDMMEDELIRLAGPDIALTAAIRVPGRVITPFSVTVLKERGGGLELVRCAVRNESEAARIRALTDRMAVEDAGRRCVVGLGGPHGEWVNAVEAAVEALDRVPAGRVDLTYRRVRFDALPPTRIEDFETALAGLAATLPPGFALSGGVEAGREIARAARERERYWMRIDRFGSGMALEGFVEDDLAGRTLETLAAAKVGRANLRARLRPAGGAAPPGWQAAVLSTIEAMGDAEAVAELTLRGVRLSATVADPVEAGRLHERLAARLPRSMPLTSRIRVDLPAAVERLSLGGARCVAVLNRTVTARQILFDLGSARIDEASRSGMEVLAGILRRCPDTRVEIGGHTDDQGAEDYNQRLSRNRASAVRDALIEFGIRHDRLTSRGYGESEPVADNATPEGRALNRRIAFRLVDQG